jgi:3-oxoacyl-[acyl-carrier-protein] synthase II
VSGANYRRDVAVVITGMGAYAPGDLSAAELAERAAQLEAGHRPATQEVEVPADLGAGERPVRLAQVPSARLEKVPGVKRPLPDKVTLLAIGAADAALRCAGLPNPAVDPSRIATIANTCAGPNATVERFLRTLLGEGPTAISPIAFSRTVVNACVGEIARRYGLTGPSTLIMGSSAVGYGVDLLRAGAADAVLCMGLDEARPGQAWAYRQAGVDPDGMVISEGGAALVLETEASALARGAAPLGRLVDTSMSFCPEAAVLLTKTTAESLADSMRMVLQRAGRRPDQVTAVVCAENGDPELALAEASALGRELPAGVERLVPKACLGETFGASELLGVMAAVGRVERDRAGLLLVNAVQPGGAVSSILVGGVQ